MNPATRASEWCVVDVETTGLFPGGHDRIIEIALVITDKDGGHQEEWHSLINPERDLGPTSIHGITGDLAGQAPVFQELVGDILSYISGRRLVAHNASFDLRFLECEFARAGSSSPNFDALCTMQISSGLGIGRKLSACCDATGIINTAPHTAIGDARATAELLAYLLKISGQAGSWPSKAHIPDPIVGSSKISTSGKATTRSTATAGAKPKSYLSRLADSLPTPNTPSGASSNSVATYADLLDQVLEDRIVTTEELRELTSLAIELKLNRNQLVEINRSYMRGLVSIALADGVITPAEQHDLDRTAALLGINQSELTSFLAKDDATAQTEFPGDGCEFEGKTVCFTGSSCCMLNGERLTRQFAIDVATAAGLEVVKNVTKKLEILVVADAQTQSGKAKKARGFGTRIIAERSFWPRLGVTID